MRRAWLTVSASLWFVPGAIVGTLLLLAIGLVEWSARVDPDLLRRMPRLFGAGADGARAMLSTIASSVITVAGVAFSITIATLALASAQYTPRVLRTFMADRANQVVLGMFVGIFAYCVVVLRTIRGGDEGAFVPSIAVLAGVILALVAVGALIFFVHHIGEALQPSTILERVRVATERAIRHLFPADVARPLATPAVNVSEPGVAWHAISAPRTGYLQQLDAEALVAHAREAGVTFRMERQVGDFVIAGEPLVSCARAGGTVAPSADETTDRRVLKHFTIAPYRTVEQDPAFGILQIVDIALKALSPGVNDTTTAVACVDHLGALLSCLAGRTIPARIRGDDQPRLVARGPTFDSLVSLALDDVRRSAEGNVRVLHGLYGALDVAGHHTSVAGRRSILLQHVTQVDAVAERSVLEPADLRQLRRHAEHVRCALEMRRQPPE